MYRAITYLSTASAALKTVFTNATDGKKTIGKTTQTLVTSVLMTGLSVGISMFTARTLGAQGRGELAALMLWPQLIASFAGWGMQTAFIYHAKKYPEYASRMLGWTLLLALLSSLIAAAGGWWVAGKALTGATWVQDLHILSGLTPDLAKFTLAYLWIAVPVTAMATVTSVLAQGLGDFRVFNSARILLPGSHLLLMGVLWSASLFDAKIAALCYAGGGTLATIWAVWRLWQHFRPQFREWPGAQMLSQLRYGMRSFGADVFGAIYNQIDKVFVLSTLSLRELGIYSVAYGASRLLTMLHNSVASVIFPATANLPVSEVAVVVSRAARISLALTLAPALILLFFGRYILGWVFGAEFAEGATVLQLLVVETMVSGSAWVLAQAFNAVGRPGLVFQRHAIGFVALVVALTILAPRYGAEGVAMALLLGGLVNLVLTLASFPGALGHPIPGLIFTRADWNFARNLLLQRAVTS